MSIHTSALARLTGSDERIIIDQGVCDFRERERAAAAGLHVVVIDNRTLFGECFLAGLRAADPSFRFTLFQTVEQWLAERSLGEDALLLLCMTEAEFESAAKGDDKVVDRLKTGAPSVRFIIVSSREDPGSILKALEFGAGGYIPTSMKLRVVVEVLRLVQAGGVFVPAASFMTASNRQGAASRPQAVDIGVLSPRQVLVARALRKGTPNKLIAYELNMCESTVKVHVRQIMKKLKAKNRTQIAFLTNEMFSAVDG